MIDAEFLELGRVYWDDGDVCFVRYLGPNTEGIMPGYKHDCHCFEVIWDLGRRGDPSRATVPRRRIALWRTDALTPVDAVFLGGCHSNMMEVINAFREWAADE